MRFYSLCPLCLSIGRQLPLHKGAFFMFTYDVSIFLTSTAFVDTKAKYGISLSRYTVFLQNCPLGYAPNGRSLFLFFAHGKKGFFINDLDTQGFRLGQLGACVFTGKDNIHRLRHR